MEHEKVPGYLGGDESSLTGSDEKAGSETAALPENDSQVPRRHLHALLDARGIGAHMANGEDPDDYVRQLREGWD